MMAAKTKNPVDIRKNATELALVVQKTNYGGSGIIWLMKREQQLYSSEGMEAYELADWVLYDVNLGKIIGLLKDAPPFKTRLRSNFDNRKFVQVRVPLVYFSDRQYYDMVAYSPGIGRVGSFFRQNGLVRDSLYFAWIAFAESYKDADLQTFMWPLNVKWVLIKLEQLIQRTEIEAISKAGHISPFDIGIVVDREVITDCDNQRGIRIKFYNLSNGTCECLISSNCQTIFPVGSWARFLPIRNNSLEMTAASPFEVDAPKGVTTNDTTPTIKLSISHNLYSLDQDPAKNIIYVPNLFGELHCTAKFLQELRQLRQKQKHFLPRLYIACDPTIDTNLWIPIDFDGKGNEPSTMNDSSIKENQHNTATSASTRPSSLTEDSRLSQPVNQHATNSSFLPNERSRCNSSSGRERSGKTESRHRSSNINRESRPRQFVRPSNKEVLRQPKMHSKIAGIVVSVVGNLDSFYVYSSTFPNEEFSLNRRDVSSIPEGLERGKWIKFDLKEDSRGKKEIIHCELDTNPPTWKVTPVRNTIQIELSAFVPRKWHPESLKPEDRVVPTNWIDGVLDRQGLLTQEMADKEVKVLVERHKDASGRPWHVKKILHT